MGSGLRPYGGGIPHNFLSAREVTCWLPGYWLNKVFHRTACVHPVQLTHCRADPIGICQASRKEGQDLGAFAKLWPISRHGNLSFGLQSGQGSLTQLWNQ